MSDQSWMVNPWLSGWPVAPASSGGAADPASTRRFRPLRRASRCGREHPLIELGTHPIHASGIPTGRLRVLARYASGARAQVFQRMPAERGIATLLAFACERSSPHLFNSVSPPHFEQNPRHSTGSYARLLCKRSTD
jgi:hypothetical protein